MVQTITPVVHGGRRGKWAGLLALHVAGAALAAAVLGAGLGATGRALGGPWGRPGMAAVAIVAGLYALREMAGLPVPVPALRKQVPRWWRSSLPGGVAAIAYGLTLGVGFVTFLKAGTLVAVAAAAFAGADPALGALLIAGFGVTRGLAVAVAWTGTTDERVQRVVDRLEALAVSALPRWANAGTLVAVAVAALISRSAEGAGGRIPATALGLVFAWAALAKVLRPAGWRRALAAHRLPGSVAVVALTGVPLAEAAVAGLALRGMGTAAGLGALVLLAGFSLAILRARRVIGGDLPCGCFGGRRTRSARLLLARNAALAILALTGVAAGTIPPPLGGVRPPYAGEWLPAGLAMLGLAGAAWALRWAGRLREGRAR